MSVQGVRSPAKGTMPLLAHLVELRRRLLFAALGLVAGAIGGWFLSDPVLGALREPIVAAAGGHRLADLNYETITGAFDLRLRIAIYLGAVLSSPVWMYQVWAFLVPALTRRELRYAIGFFASAVPLFLAGCVSGWLVVPHIVTLLTGFTPAGSTALIQATGYFDFILKLVLATGVAFMLPVFLVLLNLVGVLSGRTILKGWRVALLLITVFTALITPSADIVSMLVLAVPMLVLYFTAAFIAVAHDRRVRRRLEAMADALAESLPVDAQTGPR